MALSCGMCQKCGVGLADMNHYGRKEEVLHVSPKEIPKNCLKNNKGTLTNRADSARIQRYLDALVHQTGVQGFLNL